MKPKKPSMAGEKGAAVEKDATGKSAFDASGKGPVIGTEAGTEGKDKTNRKSISAKPSAASPKVEKASHERAHGCSLCRRRINRRLQGEGNNHLRSSC